MYEAYPRQTVLVTTRHRVKDKFSTKIIEKDNVMAVDWHTPLSFEPKLYGISIAKTRYSLHLIRESKVFCVNFIPKHFKEVVEYVGRHSGEHIDKFEKANIEIEDCSSIDCCRIKGVLAYFECEVVKEIETGDHIFIIGKITGKHEEGIGKRLFHMKHGDFFTTTVD